MWAGGWYRLVTNATFFGFEDMIAAKDDYVLVSYINVSDIAYLDYFISCFAISYFAFAVHVCIPISMGTGVALMLPFSHSLRCQDANLIASKVNFDQPLTNPGTDIGRP